MKTKFKVGDPVMYEEWPAVIKSVIYRYGLNDTFLGVLYEVIVSNVDGHILSNKSHTIKPLKPLDFNLPENVFVTPYSNAKFLYNKDQEPEVIRRLLNFVQNFCVQKFKIKNPDSGFSLEGGYKEIYIYPISVLSEGLKSYRIDKYDIFWWLMSKKIEILSLNIYKEGRYTFIIEEPQE